MPYTLFIPSGYDPDRPTPLVVDLHGLNISPLMQILFDGTTADVTRLDPELPLFDVQTMDDVAERGDATGALATERLGAAGIPTGGGIRPCRWEARRRRRPRCGLA